MIASSLSFGAGYLIGQAWAMSAYREAIALADALTARLVLIVGIETAIAVGVFFLGLRVARFVGSPMYVLALLTGIFTNAITVGTYATVPIVVQNDLQLVLNAAVVGLLSFAMGWAIARFSKKVPHAV